MHERVISKRARHERVSRQMIKAMAKHMYATVSDSRDEEELAKSFHLQDVQFSNLLLGRGFIEIPREFCVDKR